MAIQGAYLIGFLLASFFMPAALLATTTTITMKSSAVVDKNAVRITDIAVVSNSSQSQSEALSSVIIAKSPLPGQTRFVGADYVRIRLKQAGLDISAIQFDGSKDVKVSRRAATLPVEKMKKAVEQQIRNRMPWNDENVTISGITFDDDIRLPTGPLTYKIVPKRNEDYLGRTILALHLFVGGEPVRKIWANANISVTADVVTVIRPLGKHQHIQSDDVAIQRRDLAKLPSDTVHRIEDVLGNRATRMIYPNTVLQSGMVALPPLVRRGDVVKIVAYSGPMTITATGIVKQRGRKGEMVRVVNTDSRRIITARVTGPGTLAVEF